MTDLWEDAAASAERALRGDAAARLRASASAVKLCHDQDLLRRPYLGRDLAYLTAVLEALGLVEEAHALLEHVVSQLLWDQKSISLPTDVRNELAVVLADRGHAPAAVTLLSTAAALSGSDEGEAVAARTLVNLAGIKLRLGDLDGAKGAADRALTLGASDGSLQDRLEIRLLAEAVLAGVARRHGRDAVADELVHGIASTGRQLVRLLGGDHPASLSALVTLARAEFESALAAGDHERLERAADVLAVAAQKASATLGPRHPLALSALVNLATTEFEAAQASGDERRLDGARAMVLAAAQRSEVERRAAARTSASLLSAREGKPARTVVVRRAPVVPEAPAQERTAPRQRAVEQAQSLRFSVLGAVRSWRDGESLPSGSPQQRALLATLLLREGRTSTAAELIDAVWGEEPPSQALAAIRTYASRLRKVLDPGVLVSESGGYALRVPHDCLDLHVAEDLAVAAERARVAGDRSTARALINKSLALWDGEPLASVPGPFAETQRIRLTEWRLQLLEARLGMDLDMGRHAEVVSELTALTAAHPLRERLRELLMLALYRSGRQAEALAVYADTRRLLAEELGVEPRPELDRLQQRIVDADPALSQLAARSEPAPAPVRPAQLPATVSDFTGRVPLVRQLVGALAGVEGSVMAVSAVAGIGGVGKTTLAVHVAHELRRHFPDGQLYVDLQGTSPLADSPEAVLGSFLRALGTPDARIPDTLAERAALYRSMLDGRRILVVLDNARDATQIRELLPGTAGCAALVTSRVRMVDLAGAHLVDLDVMSPGEALQLFTKIVGVERVQAERKAALDVVAACGFLPLAIRIAASRLAARRTWTVSVLAAKLADERRRLDELQAGQLAVKATFELGYGRLKPAQARAFRLLGLAEGPDISLAAAAAVLGLPLEETEELLEALVDTSLLESSAPGRYRYDELVRLYARACAEIDRTNDRGQGEQPLAEGDSALSRLLDFYLATASQVYAIERPGDGLAEHLERAAVEGMDFTDENEARDWLRTEASCVLACARQSTAARTLRRAADLLWSALDLAEAGTNVEEYEVTAAALRDAALEQGDARTERRVLVALSTAHLWAGRYDEADREAERVLALANAVAEEDPLPTCWAADTRGLIAVHRHRTADAEAYLTRAVEGFRALGNRPGEARALTSLSRVHLSAGRTSDAVDLARQGTAIHDEMGQVLRGANGRYALGLALRTAGQLEEAAQELQRALRVFRDSDSRLWEGTTHLRIAEVHLAGRRPADAAQHAEQALATGCIGGDPTRANVLTVLGRALKALGESDRARACWHEALTIVERTESPDAAELHSLLAGLTNG